VTQPERGDARARDASALAAELAELGVHGSFEPRDRLVLLVPEPASVTVLQSDETRRAVLARARQHGFTHVAIELPNDRLGAGEPRTDAPLLRD
jgi:hypothetical protein